MGRMQQQRRMLTGTFLSRRWSLANERAVYSVATATWRRKVRGPDLPSFGCCFVYEISNYSNADIPRAPTSPTLPLTGILEATPTHLSKRLFAPKAVVNKTEAKRPPTHLV